MHLTAAEWARIEALFPLAAELAGEARARFLDRECAGEERLRRELEAMLAADTTQDRLLDAPIGLTSTERKPDAEGLVPGTRLGSWKIRSLIGTGGMGEVYLAERADGAYAMSAAIKLLKRELFSYANAQRFLRERRVLARLSHPNIARVLDAGTTDDGRPFLVMEYAPGARITDYARERMLAPRQIAQLMVAVAEAVAEAHRHGVVHRDLKPANVMVTEPQQVKLLDFGIARLLDETDADRSGAVPMTPAYAAPEQILDGELTPATDVYALGVMLFQLLTHTLPHLREGLPLPVIAAGLRDEAVERPSRVVLAGDGPFYAEARQKRAQEIEGELDRIVLKALHSDPRQRHANATEFADDLRRFLEGGSERKYWAFISYSHQDEAWAQWLHKSLETWRVPRRLVGRPLGDETVPRRLFPVFRDRDELPSSHELGAVINQALRQSRNLIVVCSPRSATSRWVNEEIKAFRALGRSHRVFCLIVDGEPHASNKPEFAFSECFPPALREEGFEPIAADARERKDGKAGARLKLLAGLLNVGLDELRQRERQRMFRERLLRTGLALAVVAALAGTAQWFLSQRAEREHQIALDRLEEAGRLELLDGRQARAAVFLNEARKLGGDSVALQFMLGQAMQPVEALTNVSVKHGGSAVRKAAFSPDGTRFVLVLETEENVATAKVYDAATGRELMELPQAPPAPRAVRFLGEEHLLITGFSDTDENGPVTCLWDLRQPRREPLRLAGYNGRVGEPVSADGTRFLIAGKDGLDIHAISDGRRLRRVTAGRPVAAASYGPDGTTLALAYTDGVVEIRPPTGMVRTVREAAGQPVVAVAFTPDGQRVVALSAIGDMRMWTTAGAPTLAFAVDPDWVGDFSFDRSGRRMLTVGSEGFKVWSVVRGTLLFTLPQPVKRGASGALSPDGGTAFIADVFSNHVDAWDVLGKRKLHSLDYHTGSVTALGLDQAGERLLLASRDGSAEIWRTAIRPLWTHQSFDPLPFIARIGPDGSQVAVGRGDYGRGDAVIFDAATGALQTTLAGHTGVVLDVAFDVSGDRIVTASWDGTAAVWGARNGQRLHVLDHRPRQVTGAAFSRDGRRLLTTARKSHTAPAEVARLWTADGHLIAELEHAGALDSSRPAPARFDAAGKKVATATTSGAVKIWSADDGRLLQTLAGHGGPVTSLEFSRDSSRLLSASLDNSVRIWELASGTELHKLEDAALALPSRAVWSPDETSAAVASRNGNVWVWHPDTGERLTLHGHKQWAVAPLFVHGGELLMTYGTDGSVQAWDPERGLNLGIVANHFGQLVLAEPGSSDERLVTSSWGQVSLWDVDLEHRAAEEVGAILRCRAPWSLDPAGTGLVQVAPADCVKPKKKGVRLTTHTRDIR